MIEAENVNLDLIPQMVEIRIISVKVQYRA